jgi:hypothetical protein
MPGTAVLIGLWLRGLKQKKCLAIVTEWHGALTTRLAANENGSPQRERDKAEAAALLEATCETCVKLCPRRSITIPAPRRHAAHPG